MKITILWPSVNFFTYGEVNEKVDGRIEHDENIVDANEDEEQNWDVVPEGIQRDNKKRKHRIRVKFGRFLSILNDRGCRYQGKIRWS